MADLNENHPMTWLEMELTRQLAPVIAPESLWDRIHSHPRAPRRRFWLEGTFWPVAVVMVLLSFAGVLRALSAHYRPALSTDQELAALAERGGRFDFRSDNFDETRSWVKAESNIDIDVPSAQPAADRGAVRLLGARVFQLHGLPVAAIDYRAGDGFATLFVSGKQAGLSGNTEASKHLFSQTTSSGDARILSWNRRGQTYTIVFSGAMNPHSACLLCHANTPS